jgi:hypothetical protein
MSNPVIPADFIAAVRFGLAMVNLDHDDDASALFARCLYVNTTIGIKQHGQVHIIENPHFMGRNISDISKTIRSMQ